MKRQKLWIVTTLLTAGAVCMTGTLTAADAKAEPKKPAVSAAAQPAAKTPAKAKTLNDAFAFLPDVLAVIGDKKITKQDFLKQLGNVPPEYIAQLQPEMIKAQSKQMIDMLVKAEVLLALAEKAGYKSSKETVLAEFDKKLKSLPKEQLDMIEKQLKLQGKTLDDVKKQLVSDPNAIRFSAIQKYVDEKIRPSVKVSDADIEKFYRENQDKFKTPETVNAAHILISTMPDPNAAQKPDAAAMAKKDKEAKAKAEKILSQLKQGADFAKLAAAESACDSKKNGGNLGEFGRGMMVPEFEKAAFALTKSGELSPVVKTQFGYHIIKLEAKTPASVFPLAEVKNSIKAQLEKERGEKLLSEILTKQKKVMEVKISDFK